MPMRSDGITRGRIRRRRSELDSVGEDVSADDEAWGNDGYEGWGPIRLRPGHLRDAH